MSDSHEEARLDALRQLNLLDTPPSESFDRITRMASQIFDLPIAAISLTDKDRQWFKSRVGVEHETLPRDAAPCAAVAEALTPVVVPDLLAHPDYARSVLAGRGARFYAGAPLTTRDGYGLGALCVIGTEPRSATEAEMKALVDLAAMVMSQIELQHAFGRVDPVSGLPNRNQFVDDVADAARDTPGALRMAVLIDLARTEQISSITRVMGPGALDDMVRDAARVLRRLIPADRQAYHVAATQFAVVVDSHVQPEEFGLLVASRLAAARSESSIRFMTTTAVGVAPFAVGTIKPADLLRIAHSAALDAREHESGVSVYSATSDDGHQRRFRLLHDFGTALAGEAGQLRIVVQPRVHLASRTPVGAEVLLRWRHPELGEVSPAEFIPIVEQSSLARQTTDWVLDAALRQLRVWSDAALDLPLSVNVSATNLEESDFAARVQLFLLKHRVRPDQLELEVTESAVMTRGGHALEQLHLLKQAGIRLAIDDFGTGYSSLAYLQKLPADVVKIDQSFVRCLEDGERQQALVRSMIALSHDLGYRVVAEGVETEIAADLLQAMACDEVQGYFFGRPLETTQFASWMEVRKEPEVRSVA